MPEAAELPSTELTWSEWHEHVKQLCEFQARRDGLSTALRSCAVSASGSHSAFLLGTVLARLSEVPPPPPPPPVTPAEAPEDWNRACGCRGAAPALSLPLSLSPARSQPALLLPSCRLLLPWLSPHYDSHANPEPSPSAAFSSA